MTRFMKTPDDLDPFDSDQIQLTRSIDAEKGGAEKLASMMFQNVSQIVGALQMACPINAIQRACYEAKALESTLGDTVAAKLQTLALWRVVEFMQANLEDSKLAMNDPEIRKHITSIGEKFGVDILGHIDRESEE